MSSFFCGSARTPLRGRMIYYGHFEEGGHSGLIDVPLFFCIATRKAELTLR